MWKKHHFWRFWRIYRKNICACLPSIHSDVKYIHSFILGYKTIEIRLDYLALHGSILWNYCDIQYGGQNPIWRTKSNMADKMSYNTILFVNTEINKLFIKSNRE
jgi:hypothetical protein